MTKRIATGVVMCALAFVPAQRVMADGGDFVLGVAAGVIGSAVVRDMKKKNQASQSAPAASSSGGGATSAAREQNREVQTALNYFAFPVGTPDGVLGRKSRAGISDYQAFMGYPVTGELTPGQREVLVNAFYRAQAGGAATEQAIASNPQGVRGLLTAFAASAAPAAATTEAAGQLPAFLSQPTRPEVLSVFCQQVDAATGGIVPVSADAESVLSGQFCIARGMAIAESEALMDQITQYTPQEIAAQCRGFGPLLTDYVTALGQQTEAEVLERVSGWTLSSGVAPDALAGMARVCLGSGYAQDDLGLAIGSALVLSALGEMGYAELPGHHLAQGFGVPRRPDLALDWYDAALAAPVPVFSAGDPGRTEQLRRAVQVVGGRSEGGQLPAFATEGASVTQTSAEP